MATKKTKPETFGDEYSRCLISSIAAYDLLEDAKIQIHLKSGKIVEMIYQVEYLAKLAFAKLDSYFKVDAPEAVACRVCTNKDKIYVEEGRDRTYCNFCYGDKEYFKAPGEVEDE